MAKFEFNVGDVVTIKSYTWHCDDEEEAEEIQKMIGNSYQIQNRWVKNYVNIYSIEDIEFTDNDIELFLSYDDIPDFKEGEVISVANVEYANNDLLGKMGRIIKIYNGGGTKPRDILVRFITNHTEERRWLKPWNVERKTCKIEKITETEIISILEENYG